MPSTTPLTDAINALTTYANTTTGASDTTLSDAVATLVAGFSSGGAVHSGTYTPTENTTSPSWDIGADFDHFVMYGTTDPRGNNIKVFIGCVLDLNSAKPTIFLISSNNSGSAMTGSILSSTIYFTKSGTTLTCSNPGTSGADAPGYWYANTTYQWYAW